MIVFRAAILFFCFSQCLSAQGPSIVRLLEDSSFVFEFLNVPKPFLVEAKTNTTALKTLISIKISDPDTMLPDVLGSYDFTKDAIRFIPRFLLVRGQSFKIKSRYSNYLIDTIITVREDNALPLNKLEAIYPTTSVWPENLLRFYLYFRLPMGFSNPYSFLKLNNVENEIKDPFVEIPEGLWNDNRTRLTVLFHPGRLKRGVGPNIAMGAPLQADQTYSLEILDGWKDFQGKILQPGIVKTFTTKKSDRTPIGANLWKLSIPTRYSADPLIVDFFEPLDWALLQRCISIHHGSGATIQGKIDIQNEETKWLFVPNEHWNKGDYYVRIETFLEDLAGNNLVRVFDRDILVTREDPKADKFITIPFQIK